jgi:hypothetical protein
MAQADASSELTSSSSVCNLTVEKFAEEVAKRLKSDRYSKFIFEEEVDGESFLVGGDALIETFTDLDNDKRIKKGNLAILKDFRKTCLGLQGSTDERCSGKAARVPDHDSQGRELVVVEEGAASGGGGDENRRGKKSRSGQLAPAMNGVVTYTAEEIFKTLWHSKKWTLVVGKNGVRRLQGLFANLSSRVYVDLGLDDYAPCGSKEKKRPSEEELERLKAVNCKKKEGDRAWRDRGTTPSWRMMSAVGR